MKKRAAILGLLISILASSLTAYAVGPGEGLPAADGGVYTSGPGSTGAAQQVSDTSNYGVVDLSDAGTFVTKNGYSGGIPSDLYRVLREEGNDYIGAYYGGEIRLSKSEYAPVTQLTVPTQSETRLAIIKTAFSHVYKPYQWSGSGPDSFDCSGFVNACYAAAGISIPRMTGEIGAMANITKEQLKPGDIVWKPGHVGIFLGDGMYIHAEGTGTGVIIGSFPSEMYSGFINAVGD